jgi:hypothetical protein
MSWPLSYEYGLSAHTPKRFGSSKYQQWVCVDRIARSVVYQIGFEDHSLASEIDRKKAQTGCENLIKILGVLLRVQDRNS